VTFFKVGRCFHEKLVSDRVVCVCGAYCRACEWLNDPQSACALHVMWNAFVNNQTLSQLNLHTHM